MMEKTVFLKAGVVWFVNQSFKIIYHDMIYSGMVALFVLHALDVGFCCAYSLPPFSSKMVSECLS